MCGVWYGYQDARDIGTHKKNPAVLIFDGLFSKLYGAQSADTVTLDKTHRFAKSENVVRCLYCKDSGNLPTAACTCDLRGHRLEYGYFKKGTEPKVRCDAHIFVDYDSKTQSVAAEHCPKENLIRAALVKNYNRAFPCEITVLDAPYTYRHLPFGTAPAKNENMAFFQGFYEKDGRYIGVGGKKHSNNCYCAEHEKPPEETALSQETDTEDLQTEQREARETEIKETESVSEREQTQSEAIRESETESKEEETMRKKRLIPWSFSDEKKNCVRR